MIDRMKLNILDMESRIKCYHKIDNHYGIAYLTGRIDAFKEIITKLEE